MKMPHHPLRQSIDALVAQGAYDEARQKLAEMGQQPAWAMWAQGRLFMIQPGWGATLQAGGLRLRPPVQDDAGFLLQTLNDRDFMRKFNRMSTRHWLSQEVLQVLARQRADIVQDRSKQWVVEHVDATTGQARHLGLASLAEVQIAHLRAEFLIGFPTPVSSVLAFRASVLLIEHAFLNLGLQKLTSVVFADNTLAQQSALAIGFAQEGYRVQHLRDPSTLAFIDCHENGLTREAYLAHGRMARVKARVESRVESGVGYRQGKAERAQDPPWSQSGVL